MGQSSTLPICSAPCYPRYQPQPICHNRQTSRLTYKTKTYASSCTIANCCAVKTKTYASCCAIASCCAVKTKTYASYCTIASCCAVKTKTNRQVPCLSRPRSPGKGGGEKTATSAQLPVLSDLP